MFRDSALIFLFCCLSLPQAYALDLNANNYDVYDGVTTDGQRLLYVLPSEQILILHGEIATPIVYIPDIPAYTMWVNPDGSLYNVDINYDLTVRNIVGACTYFGITCTPSNHTVFTGDFNGDSHADLLLQGGNGAEGSVVLVINENGAPINSESMGAIIRSDVYSIEVVDVNNDGRDDINV